MMEGIMAEKKKALEAMLMACRAPLRPNQLARILGITSEEVVSLIEILKADYLDRGLVLIEAAEGYRLGTNPACAPYVEAVVNPALEVELSPAALEALAIISYKQPSTRSEVEKIRGVDSGGVIKYLLELELVGEVGRAETVGRPILYATTELFLEKFGLKNLAELPPWQEIRPEEQPEREPVSEKAGVIFPPVKILSATNPPPPGNPLLN